MYRLLFERLALSAGPAHMPESQAMHACPITYIHITLRTLSVHDYFTIPTAPAYQHQGLLDDPQTSFTIPALCTGALDPP
jgi:hypothetical protein